MVWHMYVDYDDEDLNSTLVTWLNTTGWTCHQAPAIISFQIENGKFIEKNDKFIVSFSR